MRRALRTQLPDRLDTLGERIRHARVDAGLSQEGLAQAVSRFTGSGCNKSLVSQWERDIIKNPNNVTLIALEKVTGFAFEWLVHGHGPKLALERDFAGLDPKLAAAAADVLRSALASLGALEGEVAKSPDEVLAEASPVLAQLDWIAGHG